MECQKASVPSSRKLRSGHEFKGKNMYNDIFNGSAKLGCRVEDYREIFGGSAASSIPILDVPELNERMGVNAQSSRVDYSKIFGGFGEAEFAMPYEELFAKPKKARAPDEARLKYAEPEHSNISGEKRVASPEASFHSKDDVKQFNVSYNKTGLDRGDNGTNGATHVAKLHAMPGYTCLIDDTLPSRKNESGKPVHSVSIDTCSKFGEELRQWKPHSKAVSGPQPRMISAETSSSIHAKFQKNSTHNRSISHDISFDAFEIGLGAHSSERAPVSPPSGLSPNLVNNNHGGSSQSIKSKFWDARNDCSESGAAFLDEEIDTSSAAATSVAALRKAIEEAQAKIKIAKELMERRRSSNGLKAEKLSSSNISKTKNGVIKAIEETKKSEETEAQEVYQREDIQKQVPVDFSKHNAPETSQETSEIINERKSSSVLVEAKNMELKSTQMHHRLDQPEAGEVPKTFAELAYDGQLMATELKLGQVDNEIYKMPSANAVEWSKKMKIEENIEKPKEQNKTTKALKEDAKINKFENELNPFKKLFEWNIFANIVKSAKELHHKDGNEEKVMVADEDEGAHHISKLSFEELNSNPKNVHEPEENTKHEIPDLEDSIDMEEPKEFQNCVEFEKKQAEKYHEEDVKIGMDEVTMSADVVNWDWEMENEKGHEGARNDTVMGEGTEKKLTEDYKDGLIQDEEDCEKSMREDGKINGGDQLEEVKEKKLTEDYKDGLIEDEEDCEKSMREDGEINGGDQLEEVKDIEKSLEDNILMNETEERAERVYEKVESERIILEMQQSTEDEKNLETTQQAFGYNGISFEVVDVYDQDETEDVVRTHDAVGHERNLEGTEVTAGLMTMEEHEKEKDRSESYSPAVDHEDEMEEKESGDCTGLAHVFTGLQGINDQVDTSEILVIDKSGEHLGQIESNFEQKEKEDHMTGYTGVCSQEKDFTEMPCELDENCVDSENHMTGYTGVCSQEKDFTEMPCELDENCVDSEDHMTGYTGVCSQEKDFTEMPCELDENCVDSEESDIVSNCEENEKNFIPIHSNIWLGNRIATENAFGTENCYQEVPCELGETHDDVNKSEVSASNKTDDTYFDSSPDRRQANAHIDAETSQKPCPLEQRETTTEISEEKKTNESSCEEGDDHDQMLTREEKEAEANFQKEVMMEKESPKQKEAKNRDMEKEREKIAVERAIREARERAFAEAKERAGRAAAEKVAAAAGTEAQKRVTSEARERLENPSTQANHKSTAEKASLEAKLKAERAAVERATAEARERALEKAMSEKARNKSDRSTTDKFSGASRDDGATSEDQQKKGQGPSSSSRYPSRGAKDELDQRCKDTLERNQRTADRTPKALAEKNMRDLLVQKEQAERNRLAENLDAEVKRWSSGKERNLRALLSTLQFILGPDSGWKPIPLTDLVPTAAVKKAYRRATLFVHPDKLQQRGASIQQKYTCEKVFDLLKEAWNKFNSEEL